MFQFPSNGKLHSNFKYGNPQISTIHVFNSLQTGNCIQTDSYWQGLFRRKQVSIPFKRETAFKRSKSKTGSRKRRRVSIPFKRGNCIQTYCCQSRRHCHPQFQFPSNGKLHSNSPFLNSMGPWLHTPQHQTRTARRFFAAEITRENATNPHQH